MAFTPFGFPHSDTSGSTLVWQLTGLFRGLHRPSSPACPKASTSCPESLITLLFYSCDSRSLALQEHPLHLPSYDVCFRWCSTFPKKDLVANKISLSDSSPILGSLKISLQNISIIRRIFFLLLEDANSRSTSACMEFVIWCLTTFYRYMLCLIGTVSCSREPSL